MYDLIIQNATVLDGSGQDSFVSDIAIKDGKIARIACGLSNGKHIINARGLTVTPGWIDSHSHSDNAILSYPDQTEKVEQGITFSITGQCGSSPAPLRSADGTDIETMGDFLKKAKDIPQGSSAAVLVGHNTLRRSVMGEENRAPTSEELEQMKALLREGLDAGAIGMSLGLFYVPGCYAELDEVITLAKVVAEHDGLLVAHIRNEDVKLIEAVEEFITIIKASGCRAVFSHHKAMWRENWGKVKATLAMIDQANAEGADIYLDVYPYCASATSLIARFVPKQFHPEGTKSALHLLDDPSICREIKNWATARWENDLSWALVTEFPEHKEYEGLNLNEIADLRGQTDRLETAFDIIRESKGKAQACFFMMCEEDVEYVIKHPRAMICTDSSVAGAKQQYHPRLRASFPRVLGRYVREKRVTSLPEMIRKMTSLAADVYGLSGKGRIAEGADADLCIFDADKIIDRADFKCCTPNNEGLCYVIVDGKIVLEYGVYNKTRAGRIFLR